MSSQSAPVSRPSKTNPADGDNGRYGVSTTETLSQRVTDRDGVTLRAEAVEETKDGARAVTMRDLVHNFTDYLDRTEESAQVFENSDGEQVTASNPHRFASEYHKKQYAKAKDLERGVRAAFGKRLHTAMLTLTASTTDDDGQPRPPADHLEDLLSSTSAVMRALRRVEDELGRVERLAVLEPHKSGHLHVHIAVFIDGVADPEDFRPVLEAHVRNCEGAGREAHGLTAGNIGSTDAVSVYHAGRDRADGGMESIASYIMEYLGATGDDFEKGASEAEDHILTGYALLWATEKRRWRPSNGAQSYMAQKQKEDLLPEDEPEWEFVGIEDGAGDIHEVPSGEGVSRATTWTVDDDPPPATDWGDLAGDVRHEQ